jgi:hypothetical protein
MRQLLASFFDRLAARKRFEARLLVRIGVFYSEIAGWIDRDGTSWSDVKRAWPWKREQKK